MEGPKESMRRNTAQHKTRGASSLSRYLTPCLSSKWRLPKTETPLKQKMVKGCVRSGMGLNWVEGGGKGGGGGGEFPKGEGAQTKVSLFSLLREEGFQLFRPRFWS